jgi:SAM-dependent methyltransferase
MPPLKAYSWDLGGAIAGTIFFGLFSYFWFSPFLGFALGIAIYLVYCQDLRSIIVTGLFLFASLTLVRIGEDPDAIWSPYNHITVRKAGDKKSVIFPPSDLRTMHNPPFYVIQVNKDFYMMNGTIDSRRYTRLERPLLGLVEQYALPHLIRPGAREVLVMGAGGGIDVEAALLHGVQHVDAVEIDPVIIQLGHQFSASQAYKDPRVAIHNTDARAFFKQTKRRYDMVVFGFLDSQSLFSQMSNIRLDGYVYTSESFREAFGILRPGGLLSISFFSSGQPWLIDRLVKMVYSASNTLPVVYANSTGQVVILAGKGVALQGPKRFLMYEQIKWKPLGVPAATDDWPYLYLRDRFIPMDYLVSIAILLAISLLFVFFSSERNKKGGDLHFFFLGAGFLLL